MRPLALCVAVLGCVACADDPMEEDNAPRQGLSDDVGAAPDGRAADAAADTGPAADSDRSPDAAVDLGLLGDAIAVTDGSSDGVTSDAADPDAGTPDMAGAALDGDLSDGAVVGPDGAVVGPDGAVVEPDGAVADPDGALPDPDGAVADPDMAPPDPDMAPPDPDMGVVDPLGGYETDHPEVDVVMAPAGLTLLHSNVAYAPDGSVYFAGDIVNNSGNVYCFVEAVGLTIDLVVGADVEVERAFIRGTVRHLPLSDIHTGTCLLPGESGAFIVLSDIPDGRRVAAVSLSLDGDISDTQAPRTIVELAAPLVTGPDVRDDYTAIAGRLRVVGPLAIETSAATVQAWLRRGNDILDITIDLILPLERIGPGAFVDFDMVPLPAPNIPANALDPTLSWEPAP